MSKSQLVDVQKDPADLRRKDANILPPHEYYNKYIRKEGEKVLTAKDYKEFQAKMEEYKNKLKAEVKEDQEILASVEQLIENGPYSGKK